MYKAIYQDKITAISEKKETIIHTEDGDTIQEITGEALFPCLVFDEVIEDTSHNVDDFIHVDGEFVLKTDDKAIRQEKDHRIAELKQYLSDSDYVANKLIESVDEAELQDLKEKYAYTLKKRREARAEINQLEK